ncbi:hypothetical protein GUITHDRAFT_143629 [Guillardia theta CCMP2712]|uniref:Uncharacterized protein n=2 Tax=Guillardia theta TaxID=55529 RepID=L1ITQ9_GUITC|nr:hypothetical protein GUITHDRAFT_143629 [Guillardia theta CCMP2712]EKX39220.1 hypothetical protein GUITHDRAFT_143629 [Guillardia theta CCMP2712]|eukprot:XP_005826200.1 hypothetical protein GUITHDRAFT_143629 [Guillardia theta CCMP2712]
MIRGSHLLRKSPSSAALSRLLSPHWVLDQGTQVMATMAGRGAGPVGTPDSEQECAGWRIVVELVSVQLPVKRRSQESHDSSLVTAIPDKFVFTAEYLGFVSKPASLSIKTSGDIDDMRELYSEGGEGQVLEFVLMLSECGALLRSEFLGLVYQHPLLVDVWDAETKFSIGTIEIPLRGIFREGHRHVFAPLVSPFLPPLGEDNTANSLPQVACSSSKQVQVQGWNKGGAIALRVLSSGIPTKESLELTPASPLRNRSQGPGDGGKTANVNEQEEETRKGDDQDALQEASEVFALMMCCKEKILDELRDFASFRNSTEVGKSKRRWSEVELSAERFSLILRCLSLDESHLQAAVRSFRQAMAMGQEADGSDRTMSVDLQRLFYDRRYSLQLRMLGEQMMEDLDEVDDAARGALTRLCRALLFAMCGQSLHTFIPAQSLFKRFAAVGVLDLHGLENVLKFLQVDFAPSSMFALWRSMCGNSSAGVELHRFVSFCSVRLISSERRQAASLSLVRSAIKSCSEWREFVSACEMLRAKKVNPAKLNVTSQRSLATFRLDMERKDDKRRQKETGEGEDELVSAAKKKMSANRDIIRSVKHSLKVVSYPKLQELICSMEEDEWQKKQRARRRLLLVASRRSAELQKPTGDSFARVQLELNRRGLLDSQGRWKEEDKVVMVPCGVRRKQVEHKVANRGREEGWFVVSFEDEHSEFCSFDVEDERMCRARQEQRLVVESRCRVRVLVPEQGEASVLLVLLRPCEEMEGTRRLVVTNFKSSAHGLARSQEFGVLVNFVRPVPTCLIRVYLKDFCRMWLQGEEHRSLHEMIVPGTRWGNQSPSLVCYRVVMSLGGKERDSESNALMLSCETVRWVGGRWEAIGAAGAQRCKTVKMMKKRHDMLKTSDMQFLTCVLDPHDANKIREQWIFDVCSFFQHDADISSKDDLLLELDKKACSSSEQFPPNPVVHVSEEVVGRCEVTETEEKMKVTMKMLSPPSRNFYLHIDDERGKVVSVWRICQRQSQCMKKLSPSPVLLILDEVAVEDGKLVMHRNLPAPLPPQPLADFIASLTADVARAVSAGRERVAVKHVKQAPPLLLTQISQALQGLGEDKASDWSRAKDQIHLFQKAPDSAVLEEEALLCPDLSLSSQPQLTTSSAVVVSLTFLPDLRQADKRDASMLSSLLGRLVQSSLPDSAQLPGTLRLVRRMEVTATHQQEGRRVFVRGVTRQQEAAKTIQTALKGRLRRREERASAVRRQDEQERGRREQGTTFRKIHVAEQQEEMEECEDASSSSSSPHDSPPPVRGRRRPLLEHGDGIEDDAGGSIAESVGSETSSEQSEPATRLSVATRRKHLPPPTLTAPEVSDAESVESSTDSQASEP